MKNSFLKSFKKDKSLKIKGRGPVSQHPLTPIFSKKSYLMIPNRTSQHVIRHLPTAKVCVRVTK